MHRALSHRHAAAWSQPGLHAVLTAFVWRVRLALQEQLRVLKEAKELAAATFWPDLSPSRQRAGEPFAVSLAKVEQEKHSRAALCMPPVCRVLVAAMTDSLSCAFPRQILLPQAVPPKLSLTSEGLSAYMASLQEKRRQLEERRKRAQARKQVRIAVGGSSGSRSMPCAEHTPPGQNSQHAARS